MVMFLASFMALNFICVCVYIHIHTHTYIFKFIYLICVSLLGIRRKYFFLISCIPLYIEGAQLVLYLGLFSVPLWVYPKGEWLIWWVNWESTRYIHPRSSFLRFHHLNRLDLCLFNILPLILLFIQIQFVLWKLNFLWKYVLCSLFFGTLVYTLPFPEVEIFLKPPFSTHL